MGANSQSEEEREGFEPSLRDPLSSGDQGAAPPPLNTPTVDLANPLPAQRTAPAFPGDAVCVCGHFCAWHHGMGLGVPTFCGECRCARFRLPGATVGKPDAEASRPEAPGGSGAKPPPDVTTWICGNCVRAGWYARRSVRGHFESPYGFRCVNELPSTCTCAALRSARDALLAAGAEGVVITGQGCALHGAEAVRS